MIAQPQRTGVTVGYQGVPGSFSSQAMHQWFGQVESRNYPKFEDVFLALQNGAIDYGVVPMENSSTGAINDNYDLINKYHFFIVGEQSIYIAQNLLGVKGAKLNDIKEVYSHPQGLLQTSQFLAAHQIKNASIRHWQLKWPLKGRIRQLARLPRLKQPNYMIWTFWHPASKTISLITRVLSFLAAHQKSCRMLIGFH